MELGRRLRQARLEQGLSQRQLCGDVITRNMLSQIENGSARPSMDTLSYLAAQLGKPVSFFLDEDSVATPNLHVIERARLLYAQKEWTQLLSQLQQYRDDAGGFDEERWLLQAVCLTELAEQALSEGNRYYAHQLLDEAAQAGTCTMYYTREHERRRLILLAEATDAPVTLPQEDRGLLLRAEWMRKAGKPEQSIALLACCADQTCARWHWLRAEAAFAVEDYEVAISHYRKAENEYGQRCYERLEACCRAVEDYKMAYEYACKRRNDS